MKPLATAAILAILLTLTACGGGSGGRTTVPPASKYPDSNVEFVDADKLFPLLDRAKEEDKLVFVDFYTSWCTPCKMMDKDVFTDNKAATFMNANFINYKVDAENGNGVNLAGLYEVQVYPTLLLLDGDGNIMARSDRALYPTQLIAFGKKGLKKYKAQKAANSSAATTPRQR